MLRLTEWHFEQDARLEWRWKRVNLDNTQSDSARSFCKRIDCVMDAVRYAVQGRRSKL